MKQIHYRIKSYLTSDSSINTYNSNDMVISLETNDNQAKVFQNLSFTATNAYFQVIIILSSHHIIQLDL